VLGGVDRDPHTRAVALGVALGLASLGDPGGVVPAPDAGDPGGAAVAAPAALVVGAPAAVLGVEDRPLGLLGRAGLGLGALHGVLGQQALGDPLGLVGQRQAGERGEVVQVV